MGKEGYPILSLLGFSNFALYSDIDGTESSGLYKKIPRESVKNKKYIQLDKTRNFKNKETVQREIKKNNYSRKI